MYYVSILDGADDAWGVRIPDCPGCHGGGTTADLVISDALSALREWVAQMRADSVAVPPQRRRRQKSPLTPKTIRMLPTKG
jgi:predicted RNase H-like HicB family nuclease